MFWGASPRTKSLSSTNSCRGVRLKFQRNRDIRPEIGRRYRAVTFNLKNWALDPAILEVNALSDFKVEVEMLRDGGMQRCKLIGFRMTWERKTKDEWNAVLDELLRPRVGRKARIRGTVEEAL